LVAGNKTKIQREKDHFGIFLNERTTPWVKIAWRQRGTVLFVINDQRFDTRRNMRSQDEKKKKIKAKEEGQLTLIVGRPFRPPSDASVALSAPWLHRRFDGA
jgi:hypothetical protein